MDAGLDTSARWEMSFDRIRIVSVFEAMKILSGGAPLFRSSGSNRYLPFARMEQRSDGLRKGRFTHPTIFARRENLDSGACPGFDPGFAEMTDKEGYRSPLPRPYVLEMIGRKCKGISRGQEPEVGDRRSEVSKRQKTEVRRQRTAKGRGQKPEVRDRRQRSKFIGQTTERHREDRFSKVQSSRFGVSSLFRAKRSS